MSQTDQDKRLPHLMTYPHEVSAYAIVVGDAKRVKQAASLMDNVREVGNNREYFTITGIYKEQRITVASHGIGAGGANLCFMELFHAGVNTIMRAGTCGALDASINDGDFILVNGAVREDAATEQLMPLGYPAIADRELLNALFDAAQVNGFEKPHIGLSVTYANFYSSPVLPPPYKQYIGYGAKALEMEMAGLLVLALMYGARAGGILTSDGNMIRGGASSIDEFKFNPRREIVDKGVKNMLKVALDALSFVAEQDQIVLANTGR